MRLSPLFGLPFKAFLPPDSAMYDASLWSVLLLCPVFLWDFNVCDPLVPDLLRFVAIAPQILVLKSTEKKDYREPGCHVRDGGKRTIPAIIGAVFRGRRRSGSGSGPAEGQGIRRGLPDSPTEVFCVFRVLTVIRVGRLFAGLPRRIEAQLRAPQGGHRFEVFVGPFSGRLL